jgi:hypothetical protein
LLSPLPPEGLSPAGDDRNASCAGWGRYAYDRNAHTTPGDDRNTAISAHAAYRHAVSISGRRHQRCGADCFNPRGSVDSNFHDEESSVMSRTVNDWGSLVLSELDGHEAPGTVGRLIAETTGKVAVDADDVATSALLKLAEKLSAPAGVRQQIKDLSSAASAAKAEQANLAKLRQDTESDLADAHAEHRARIERELADHKKAVAAAQAELETVKTQAANLLKQAKADAETAAKLKAKLERKLSALEAA